MSLITDEILRAVCWTLIHSIWQGLIAAAIAGAIISMTKRSTAVMRYNLLAGVFMLFLISAVITCSLQFYHVRGVSTSTADTFNAIELLNNADVVQAKPASPTANFVESFAGYFNRNAPLVVAIWFLVLSIRFVKLLANTMYTQRIRHQKVSSPGEYWKRRMIELSKRLHIKQTVQLFQSGIVTVPVVAGFFKPVILFPFSLLSQLPAEQIEAVLLHELAHIRRKDALVNLLQSFAETFFFFNPGILWISALIRDERENCCDDIAIGETNNKREFVNALVSFQEYRSAETMHHSMAFPGRKNHLLNRVKRIITNNNQTLNNMEKFLLACCLVVTGVCTLAFSITSDGGKKDSIKKDKSQTVQVPISVELPTSLNLADTLPVRNTQGGESISKNGKQITYAKDGYKIVCVGDKVVELYIDDQKIPDDQIESHRETTEKYLDEIKTDIAVQSEKMESEQMMLKLKTEEVNAKLEEISKAQDAMHLHSNASDNADMEKRLMALKLLQEKNDQMLRLQDKKLRFENKQHNAAESNEILRVERNKLELAERQLRIEERKLDLMMRDRKLGHVPELPELEERGPAIPPMPPVGMVDPVAPVPEVPEVKENPAVKAIIEELVDSKIVADADNMSFKLDKDVFEVNGVKQPEAMHERLRAKYVPGKKDHIVYSTHGNADHRSTHTDIIQN